MGADQSTSSKTDVTKDDMAPYMHPIGERMGGLEREGLMGFRNKLSSVGASARSGSMSSVNSPGVSTASSQPPLRESRFNRAFSTSFTSLPTSHSRDIVIVNDGKVVQDDFDYGKELEKLHKIPRALPLYRTRNASMSFDHKSALHFCARYQEHMKQCAEAIAFDQAALNTRIKEVESEFCFQVDTKARDRLRKQTRQLDQLNRFTSTHLPQNTSTKSTSKSPNDSNHTIIDKVSETINQFQIELNEINDQLPTEYRLEPFSFVNNTATLVK